MSVPILIGMCVIATAIGIAFAIIDGARADRAWADTSRSNRFRRPSRAGTAAGASAKVPGGVDVRTSHNVNVARKA